MLTNTQKRLVKAWRREWLFKFLVNAIVPHPLIDSAQDQIATWRSSWSLRNAHDNYIHSTWVLFTTTLLLIGAISHHGIILHIRFSTVSRSQVQAPYTHANFTDSSTSSGTSLHMADPLGVLAVFILYVHYNNRQHDLGGKRFHIHTWAIWQSSFWNLIIAGKPSLSF